MPFLQFPGRSCLQTFSLTFSGRGAPWLWKAAENLRRSRKPSKTFACAVTEPYLPLLPVSACAQITFWLVGLSIYNSVSY